MYRYCLSETKNTHFVTKAHQNRFCNGICYEIGICYTKLFRITDTNFVP